MSDLSPFTLTIFGASGDLAKRKLFPAVYHLYQDGLIGEDFALVGFARSAMKEGGIVEFVKNALQAHVSDFDPKAKTWIGFSEKLHYVQGAYDKPEGFQELSKVLTTLEDQYKCYGNRVFHISTPPSVFEAISSQLGKSGMATCTPDGICSRIVIEKPFGHNLASARELNRKLGASFLEKQIYRIDHYLGKETVQNILMLRFSNILLESVWNHRYIDHVQITVAEELGIEKRGSYYDGVGASRDMMQNHLMQLLCITAMEPPNNIDSDEVRDEKVKVLKSLRPFDLNDIERNAIRGQYGPSADGQLNAYRKEEGVPIDSATDTYMGCKIHIDNWRWINTPFYLRTGKRMKSRYSEIYLQFKDVPKKIFGSTNDMRPDGILIRIQPNEGVSLQMKAKVPGASTKLQSVSLGFDYKDTFAERSPDGYERLLYDAILDKPALFIRADETETSWAFFEPLFDHWKNTTPDYFPNYFAGAMGPRLADTMITQDGRAWNNALAPEGI
jgi:glucose-6-phosphate 1-dehydrogenase